MKSGCSLGNAFPYLREHIDSREGFSGLIERVTLGNSVPANRVGEGRAGGSATGIFGPRGYFRLEPVG